MRGCDFVPLWKNPNKALSRSLSLSLFRLSRAWGSKFVRVFTGVLCASAIFLGFGGLRGWISGYRLFDTRNPGDCSKSDGLSSTGIPISMSSVFCRC